MAGMESELVRARNDLGQFLPDDPTTPDVDEAWAPAPAEVNDTTTGAGGVA